MSSETGLQPEMATVDRSNQEDLPAATTNASDDLFGEGAVDQSADTKPTESESVAPEVSDNKTPVSVDTAAVDSQPTSTTAPVKDLSSGIEGVAKFLPANSNLDQPTVSPSEPLVDGEARIENNVVATDEPSVKSETAPEPESSSEQQATEGSKPANVDSVVATSPHTEQPIVKEQTNGVSEESKPALPASPKQPNGMITESESTTTAAAPIADSTSPQTAALPPMDNSVDQEMSDAPSSTGVVRAREEDESTGEPTAKRTKTGDEADGDAPAQFKIPETSSAPEPAPASEVPTTNGDSVRPQNTPKISSGPITKNQKSFLIEKMKNTKKVKSAFWFTKPVDYVTLNIPHYPTIIKKPMDLTTMEHKLKNDEYSSVDDLVGDFELMVGNCFTFNGVNHAASISAQNLRAYFLKQMQMCPTGDAALSKPKPVVKKASPKPPTLPRAEPAKPAPSAKSPTGGETFALMPDGLPMIRRDSTTGRPKRAVIPPAPRDLPYASSKPKRKEAQTGLKFCEHILEEFRKPKYDRFAAPFRVPVDPVALNIPTYFSVIRHPMDVSTITQKLKGGQYSSAQDFKGDFDLMFTNCFKFNPPDNLVHSMGKEFKQEFDREWSKKDSWIKKHTPQSQRASPASDDSDGDVSEDGNDDEEHDSNEATIALLREQLENMQNMVASIAGGKRASPKASSSKKKKASTSGGGGSKPSKKSGGSSNSRPTIKTSSKPKKQRLVTYDEKQEISNATEHMTGDQVEKLTNIITENVAKYKDMAGDDVELEIDDLPNEVQHKLLRYVRSIFPKAEVVEDANAIDDDYEPEKPSARSGGAAKKKHKPMKKHEQESRIRQLKEQMAAMTGSVGAIATSAPAQRHAESSDDDDSESSEEE